MLSSHFKAHPTQLTSLFISSLDDVGLPALSGSIAESKSALLEHCILSATCSVSPNCDVSRPATFEVENA